MVNEKVTNLRVINFFSLFLFYHQHFWDLFWSFRDAYQPSRWYLEGIKDLQVESPVKKNFNRKCLWREINPIVQGSFHWHDVRPEKKSGEDCIMRLSKEYYGHKENFCVGCYCLSSPFFMCIHNPLPWIFKTFLVYNWMLIVLKTTIHTLLTLIVLKKMWGASSLILILWPLTKTYVVYNHEFGHMKIFYQIENLKFEQFYISEASDLLH